MVAEYAYGVLVPAAYQLSMTDWRKFYAKCKAEHGNAKEAHGFHAAWLMAFVERIADRFKESRVAAVAAAPADAPGSTSTALLRLDGCLIKAQEYIEGKFKKRSRYSSALNGGMADHAAGRAAGRAAADKMVLSKALKSTTTSTKLIGGGK